MQKSLEPKPLAKVAEPKKQVAQAQDLTEALLQLPELHKTLCSLLSERRRENDYLSGLCRIDMDIKTLAVKTDQNLHETAKLQLSLDARLKTLELNEAKYRRMMNRIDSILDLIEQKLKQI
jgi:hypothetical protein